MQAGVSSATASASDFATDGYISSLYEKLQTNLSFLLKESEHNRGLNSEQLKAMLKESNLKQNSKLLTDHLNMTSERADVNNGEGSKFAEPKAGSCALCCLQTYRLSRVFEPADHPHKVNQTLHKLPFIILTIQNVLHNREKDPWEFALAVIENSRSSKKSRGIGSAISKLLANKQSQDIHQAITSVKVFNDRHNFMMDTSVPQLNQTFPGSLQSDGISKEDLLGLWNQSWKTLEYKEKKAYGSFFQGVVTPWDLPEAFAATDTEPLTRLDDGEWASDAVSMSGTTLHEE